MNFEVGQVWTSRMTGPYVNEEQKVLTFTGKKGHYH